MNFRQRNWPEMLPPLLVILAVLLVVISSLYLLSVVLSILGRFYQTILLFVLGAILAYLLQPLVNLVQRLLRKRWAAILFVYLGVFAGFILLGILLVSPFIQQGQELVKNLKTPTQSSLGSVVAVDRDIGRLATQIASQGAGVTLGVTPPAATLQRTAATITGLQPRLLDLEHPRPSPGGTAQVEVPQSYVAPVTKALTTLTAEYTRAGTDPTLLHTAAADAQKAASAANTMARKVTTTPMLVLSLQGWFDRHNISVDINQRFGNAVQQLNSELASLLNNAVNIATTTGNLLLSSLLMLIISVYFLSDGSRIIRRGVSLFPASQEQEVWFYLRSLDRVLGSYIRGQIVLAGAAGILGGLGAQFLGVPYAVLIGISTTLLSLIPVIGPVVLILPPVLIAVIFTSLPTTIFILIYFVVMMQLVTNIVGPRLLSSAVGIHPLEAMAAALIGFPLAGFLGSFFAVPIVGFVHVAVAEAYRHFHRGEPAPAAPLATARPPDPDKDPATATPV